MERKRTNAATVRRTSGTTMLLLLCSSLAAVFILGLLANFLAFYKAKDDASGLAFNVALNSGVVLNSADRQGQMNNLVYAAREAVYHANADFSECQQTMPQYCGLAGRLLTESREGAMLVNSENETLARLSVEQVKTLVHDSDKSAAQRLYIPWPGISMHHTRITSCELGYLSDAPDSNVEAPSQQGCPDLYSHDLEAGYIDKTTMRYLGNIVLQSPLPDLTFRLSSIRSNDPQHTLQASAVPGKLFVRSFDVVRAESEPFGYPAFLPSACRVVVATDVQSSGKPQQLVGASAATACGAMPAPWQL